MKCCICKQEMNSFGNNPDPLCSPTDNESRCCDICNTRFVIPARYFQMNQLDYDSEIKVDDNIAILFAKASNTPIDLIQYRRMYLGGQVTDITEVDNQKIYSGTWGNFTLNKSTDNFAKVNY